MLAGWIFGFLAAAFSPLAMTIGFIIWGNSWHSSPYALNLFKCTLASLLFMIVSFSIRISHPATFREQSMILLSSFIGIIIGDNTWLMALKLIGAKKVIIIDSLKPFCAAVLGYFFLGEEIDAFICLGMVITTIGVVMTALEQERDEDKGKSNCTDSKESTQSHTTMHDTIDSAGAGHLPLETMIGEKIICEVKPAQDASKVDGSRKKNGNDGLGYAFAAINVILDAVGAVLVKTNGTDLNSFEINYLRFGFAAVFMALLAAAMNIFIAFYRDCNSYWFGNAPFSLLVSVTRMVGLEAKSSKDYNGVSGVSMHDASFLPQFNEVNGHTLDQSWRTTGSQSDLAVTNEASAEVRELTKVRSQSQTDKLYAFKIRRDFSYDERNDDDSDGDGDGETDGNSSPVVVVSSPANESGSTTDSFFSDARSQTLMPARPSGGNQVDISPTVAGSEPRKIDPWYIFPSHERMTPGEWGKVVVGIGFVTFMCPAMSNYALFQIPLSLCLTLTSLGPVYSLPMVYIMNGEVSGPRAVIGAVFAVIGVCIFLLGR